MQGTAARRDDGACSSQATRWRRYCSAAAETCDVCNRAVPGDEIARSRVASGGSCRQATALCGLDMGPCCVLLMICSPRFSAYRGLTRATLAGSLARCEQSTKMDSKKPPR